jgi:glycosyltransferase involved in cell wall biosynthesis
MRILFCNKYSYPFSGTEAYIFEAMELIRANGHEAALFSMADPRGKPTPYDRHFVSRVDFKKPEGWFHQAKLAAHAIYSYEAQKKIRSMIAEFQPHVAHVRNFYHHLSPSILWELKAQNVPVIYHVNDFKALCPSYNLVSRGEACEACKGGAFRNMLTQKCYPGTAARMMLVAEAYIHRILGTYRNCIDCFLAPSQFVRDKFIEHGWDASKFEVLPHFQALQRTVERSAQYSPLLYFGRLSKEKGVEDLLLAMQRLPHLRLLIAGDGPERSRLEQLREELQLPNVEFAGQLRGADLERVISNSRFTVLPSHAYETLGKTILESYAWGRAVVASDLGSRRELVHPGQTGLLYRPGDVSQLVWALGFLGDHPELADKMGRSGQELVRQHYSPQSHYEALMNVYERLAAGRKELSPESNQNNRRKANLPELVKILPGRATANPAESHGLISIHTRRPLPEIRINPSNFADRKKLRIAFIGGRGVISKYSGIEAYYEEVGKRLAGMGHDVTAYCRTYFTPAQRVHNGMQLMRLPTIRSKHLETLVHTFASTLHVLTQPCDVVHYHALGPALFSWIPRLAGKKTVVTVQGLDWQRRKWGWFASSVLRLGERASAQFPTSTIVVSHTLRRHYWKRYQAQTSYVPNGGLSRERRVPRKIFDWELTPENYILFLGRFSPEKNCHLLVQAFEMLQPSAQLVLAGASSYCDDYSRQLRTHANDRIKILDSVAGDDLDELLTNAMIFVLPSDLEGLSLALLDAMGAGLCVLASDVAENREAIEDAGFTFRRGDVVDLKDRLQFLIANPAVREAAGRAARRRVREQYQWSRIAEEVERVYFEAMGWEWSRRAARKAAASVATAGSIVRREVG